MNANALTNGSLSFQLMRHQQEFVDAVLSSAAARSTLLVGGIGFGKGAALVALMQRALTVNPSARVLLLAIPILAEQVADRLEERGVRVMRVDRFRYRELSNAAGESEDCWPAGCVIVMGFDFARQADVLSSLTQGHWDLFVVEDPPAVGPVRGKMLEAIQAVSSKAVVSTAVPIEPRAVFADPKVQVIRWRREGLIDPEGRPLGGERPTVLALPYTLSEEERALQRRLDALLEVPEFEERQRDAARVTSLLRRFRSSPLAAEQGLRSFVLEGPIEAPLPEDELNESVAASEGDGGAPGPAALASEAPTWVHTLLHDLEQLRVDSKLDALIEWVRRHAQKSAAAGRHVCVLTQYRATFFYLAASLEGQELPITTMHGGLPVGDRREALNRFREHGGVLLSMHSMLTGLDLSHVTDVMLYEVPETDAAALAYVGALARLGRKGPLRVHVLLPKHGDDPALTDGFALLQKTVSQM